MFDTKLVSCKPSTNQSLDVCQHDKREIIHYSRVDMGTTFLAKCLQVTRCILLSIT